MATTNYILTGGAGTDTHIDLGLRVGDLSLSGQEFVIAGSDGNNSFFLRPDGYSFDFTANGAGEDKIYLTGARADYTVAVEDDVATLTRGTGDSAETVRVSAAASNMSIVFSDGFLAADALTTAGGETLDNSETSLAPALPQTNTGNVRVGTSGGAVDQTGVFGLNGVSFTAYGNGGIENVFVAAGGNVDATKLGAGRDQIFLEGSWSDYAKSAAGSHITLTREVVNILTGAAETETVTVIGGAGGANDRLFFADGSVDTRALLVQIRANTATPDFDITTNTEVWDGGATSVSSAAVLEGDGNVALLEDTGVFTTDFVTNNGVVNVSGLVEGYRWQHSTDGGANWTFGTGTSFTLEAQVSGGGGRTYAAGDIQVRQVNPFGVVSEAVSNPNEIVVDGTAGEFSFAPQTEGIVSGYRTGQTTGDRAAVQVDFAQATGATIQFWFHVDSDALASEGQLLGRNFGVRMEANGQLGYWNGTDYAAFTGVVVAEGWNFVSFSTVGNNQMTATIINDTLTEGQSATATGVTEADATNIDVTLGTLSGGTLPLGATFRNLAVWTGSRDAATVLQDSETLLAGDETDLQGYFKMDEAAGTTPVNAVTGGDPMLIAGSPTLGNLVTTPFPGPLGEESEISSRPVFSGSDAEAGATITVFYTPEGEAEVEAGSVNVDGNGDWSLAFDTTLDAGNYAIRVQMTDPAGNASEQTSNVTVSAALPVTPDLDAGSDSSTDTDNITNATNPTISGTLPAGTTAGTAVQIFVNGASVVSGDAAGTADGLTIDYDNATWSYTPPDQVAEGEIRYALGVGNRVSAPLTVTIDRSMADTVVSESPALIETTTFVDDNLVMNGTLEGDVTSLTITFSDNDGATEDQPAQVEIDAVNGTWTATFTRAQIEALTDGDYTLTLNATDVAGNNNQLVIDDGTVLELVNGAPVENPQQAARTGVALPDTIGAADAPAILDMSDLARNGDTTTNDTAFIDDDAAGSNNGTLSYSARLANGDPLPSWLEMTPEGQVRIVEGEAVPTDFMGLSITVTATDGAGETATRDFPISHEAGLTSVMHEVASLDVRSDIVVEATNAGDTVALTTEDGTYEIRLVDRTFVDGATGFSGEDGDGGQTISVTIAGGVVTSSVGGSVSIVDGRAVIDFGQDFDLSSTFDVEIDDGLLVNALDQSSLGAIVSEELRFSTVEPTTEGAVAQIWRDGALTDGESWYDGTSGSYFMNQAGLDVDLSSVAGIVVMGRDTDASDSVALNVGSRTNLTGFGGDDHIYIDRDVGSVVNDLTVDQLTVDDNGGAVPTAVTASGASFPAAVLVQFEDRDDTPGVDESGRTATVFTAADALPGDDSFESLTGNATPVIGG